MESATVTKTSSINIKDINVRVNGDLAPYVSADAWLLSEGQGKAEIKLSVYIESGCPFWVTIDNITIQDNGLQVVKIEPSLPQELKGGDSLNLVLTVEAPNGYEGVPTVIVHAS